LRVSQLIRDILTPSRGELAKKLHEVDEEKTRLARCMRALDKEPVKALLSASEEAARFGGNG
jgi:hypothetical protein